MTDAPDLQAHLMRLREALAACVPDDPARVALEAVIGLLQERAATLHVSGPIASARDVNIATHQAIAHTTIVSVGAADPTATYAARLAWLEQLASHYDAGAPAAAHAQALRDLEAKSQGLMDEVRLRLAEGVLLWPADRPPAVLSSLEACSRVALLLWPIIAAPLLGDPRYLLPLNWSTALCAIASDPIAALTTDVRKRYHQRTVAEHILHQHLLRELIASQYTEGIRNLLTDLHDPARGGLALEAHRQSQVVRERLLPAAARTHATLLRLLAAGVGGALVGAGTLVAADLSVHQDGALLHTLKRLVQALDPHAAPARPAAPEIRAPHPLTGTEPRAERNIVASRAGDLSIPITPEQWRDELARCDEVFGRQGLRQSPIPYWCYVRAGSYRIGGWEKDQPAATIRLRAFWITRVPITVAQYAPFVAAGYRAAARRWWTPEGWKWKESSPRTQPSRWDERPFNHDPAQPAVGTTWYGAAAFCAWLSEQIDGALPGGYILRLPTEAEWEAAAAFDEHMRRHAYPWGEAPPTPERAVYGRKWDDGPPAVGSCPAGAAACGALDMAGLVWECAASSYAGYPTQSGVVEKDFTMDKRDVPWRSTSYVTDSTFVRCGARDWGDPVFDFIAGGLRIVVAPRSH